MSSFAERDLAFLQSFQAMISQHASAGPFQLQRRLPIADHRFQLMLPGLPQGILGAVHFREAAGPVVHAGDLDLQEISFDLSHFVLVIDVLAQRCYALDERSDGVGHLLVRRRQPD